MELSLETSLTYIAYLIFWAFIAVCIVTFITYFLTCIITQIKTRKEAPTLTEKAEDLFGLSDDDLLKLKVEDMKSPLWTTENLQKLKRYAISKSLTDKDRQKEWINLQSSALAMLYAKRHNKF